MSKSALARSGKWSSPNVRAEMREVGLFKIHFIVSKMFQQSRVVGDHTYFTGIISPYPLKKSCKIGFYFSERLYLGLCSMEEPNALRTAWIASPIMAALLTNSF